MKMVRCTHSPHFLLLSLAILVIVNAVHSMPSPLLRAFPAAVPRRVRVDGQRFVDVSNNATIVLAGPNVVVKGPPYLPSTTGDSICNDVVNEDCAALGNCTSCSTFNEADINHIKSLGWNVIRLGVVWAGAQPEDSDSLDASFLQRLHSVLDLTDKAGINVVLDNHGDMTGSAGCGNGVPMWFQKQAAPELIGRPLHTDFPFDVVPSLRIENVPGFDHCGPGNESAWMKHAGDPNYNMLNECCQAMNSGGNPGGLGYTSSSQRTMDYMLSEGPGRDAFVRYWRLMAEAVKYHPSAFACELLNEPMSIARRRMFDTWRAAAEAINAVVPDMSVSVCDVGEGVVIPAWVTEFFEGAEDISHSTAKWIKESTTLFYAWHWYRKPLSIDEAVKNAQAVSQAFNMPSFATEFGSCEAWDAAAKANISHSYWHYSSYCNTGAAFGNKAFPTDTFGACILGWGGGDSSHCAGSRKRGL